MAWHPLRLFEDKSPLPTAKAIVFKVLKNEADGRLKAT